MAVLHKFVPWACRRPSLMIGNACKQRITQHFGGRWMASTAGSVAGQRPGRWRWMRAPALTAGLLLIERQLVAAMGTPTVQLRAVRDLGLSPTDPVTPLLMVLAMLAEVLIGYVLVALVLRTLSLVPGSLGRLAGRVAFLVSPGVVRRALDLLVGGALLAQTTLTALPGAQPVPATGAVHSTTVSSVVSVRSAQPIGPETRPPSRRLAAPLPPWLGGGPSKPRPGHTVEPGDTLWDIAAAHLAPTARSPANVHRYWRQIYRASRAAVGGDPDLILPGTHLDVPRFRPVKGDRR